MKHLKIQPLSQTFCKENEIKSSYFDETVFTVWQFQNLYTTQILREIYFWACKVQKMPYLHF